VPKLGLSLWRHRLPPKATPDRKLNMFCSLHHVTSVSPWVATTGPQTQAEFGHLWVSHNLENDPRTTVARYQKQLFFPVPCHLGA
jgi:hypothetical protein